MSKLMDFETIYQRVFKTEGLTTKNPHDPGNWTGGAIGKGQLKGTKGGIAAASYPDLDIENLTNEEIKEIYHRDWYLKIGIDKFSSAMRYQMFDACFNHGTYNASKIYQRAVGAIVDGVIGSKTMECASYFSENDRLFRFLAYRVKFYTSLSTFDKFGRGWSNRIADNLLYASMDNED